MGELNLARLILARALLSNQPQHPAPQRTAPSLRLASAADCSAYRPPDEVRAKGWHNRHVVAHAHHQVHPSAEGGDKVHQGVS